MSSTKISANKLVKRIVKQSIYKLRLTSTEVYTLHFLIAFINKLNVNATKPSNNVMLYVPLVARQASTETVFVSAEK